jgi:hypothetical protein
MGIREKTKEFRSIEREYFLFLFFKHINTVKNPNPNATSAKKRVGLWVGL